MATTKQVGHLHYWNDSRGFGFIHQIVDGRIIKYFLHTSQIMRGKPTVGGAVLFDPVEGPKGLFATNAELSTPLFAKASALDVLGGKMVQS